MCKIQDSSARGLIYAAVLHADQSVLYDVDDADSVGSADLIELLDDLGSFHLLTVEGNRCARLESEGDVCRLIRCLQWGNSHLEEAFLLILRLVSRILKVKSFMAEVPEVLVLGVVGLS